MEYRSITPEDYEPVRVFLDLLHCKKGMDDLTGVVTGRRERKRMHLIQRGV